ncbi:hypothetical protein ACOMHN_027841 [Nucella lapillus]
MEQHCSARPSEEEAVAWIHAIRTSRLPSTAASPQAYAAMPGNDMFWNSFGTEERVGKEGGLFACQIAPFARSQATFHLLIPTPTPFLVSSTTSTSSPHLPPRGLPYPRAAVITPDTYRLSKMSFAYQWCGDLAGHRDSLRNDIDKAWPA